MKRCLSMLLLAVLGFSQASVALAACMMDRGELAQMFAAQSHACCDGAVAQAMPAVANICLSHSTADLQALGTPASEDYEPAELAVWIAPPRDARWAIAVRLAAPPFNAVPPRILLHSFLI